jgi:predicted esterase
MIPSGRVRACLLGVVAVAVAFHALPAAELPKGRVLETVACAADPTQTYALYVPTNFDASKQWPVLFCFDPGARGKAPVERFQAAAEKFGYIVAGSNNSRNGPWEANAAAINAMVSDVRRYFPLQPKRIYVAGLSGGARVACQIALGGIAQGVIACSAGFPGSELPDRVPFAFFGTAGVTDFNYLELRRVEHELVDRGAAHRVVIFPGGHEWLPAELAMEALAWLDLQAMRTGTLAKDSAWIEAQLVERQARVPVPAGERYLALKSITADFKGLADVTVLEKIVASLGASRDVRDWLKAQRASERKERELSEALLESVQEGAGKEVQKTVAMLRRRADAAENTPDRQMAARVLQGAGSAISEGAREAMRARDYGTAASLLEMLTLLRPERGQTWFELARAYANLRDFKGVVGALNKAAGAGFKDVARVEVEKAFDPVRKDPAFVAAVAAMK